MTNPDLAPDMCTVTVPFEDGDKIVVSHPRSEIDRLSPEARDAFMSSLGHFIGSMSRGELPEEVDMERIMSIEGASLVLPDNNGATELQTFLGSLILVTNTEDATKYNLSDD